jgi:hypothetical protein
MSDSKWKGNEDKQKILYGNDYHTRRMRDAKDRNCKVKRAKHCANIFSRVDCPFNLLNYVLVMLHNGTHHTNFIVYRRRLRSHLNRMLKVIFNFYHCKLHLSLFSYFFFGFV